jgi:hypothetical protein
MNESHGPVVDTTLHSWLVKTGSFPKGDRPDPYQEYYHDGQWRPGQRSVVDRAQILTFAPKPGDSVLELGSQMGGFLQLAVLEGAAWVEGLELDLDHVAASRRLLTPLAARAGAHAQIIPGSMTCDADIAGIKVRVPKGRLDHLLLLSLGKHVGGAATLRRLVTTFNAKRTYIETNAIPTGRACPYAACVKELGGTYIGITSDRNERRVYLIVRE